MLKKIIITFLVLFLILQSFLIYIIDDYSRISGAGARQTVPRETNPYQQIGFSTSDNIRIAGWFKKNPLKSDKTVIISHGFGSSKMNMIKQADVFYKDIGANVFLYDFRGHGNSSPSICTFGDKEREDLRAVIRYLNKEYSNETKNIILYGVSMGAAVSLAVGAEFKNVKLIISDSAYKNLGSALIHHAKELYNVPVSLCCAMNLAYRIRFLKFKPLFSPLKKVKKINNVNAIFYIHSKGDNMIPYQDALELDYKTNKKVKTKITLYNNAGHAESFAQNTTQYIAELKSFILENL